MAGRDLALIVVGTISADQRLPSAAIQVQQKIGATCPAFDLAAACSGFLYGLDVATRFVLTGTRPVLVVGVEVLSRLLDWTDRETCVLFGDGAGAAIVDLAEDGRTGVLATLLAADGRHAGLLQIPADEGVVRMRGQEIFRLAVSEMAAACSEVLRRAGLAPGEVGLVVAHQANRRILEAVARRIGIPWERFHLTIDRYGNTSSASIPIGLADALETGRLVPGTAVLMAALGAGATWAASVCRF
jgi:3-oxoacyl-[acyl-carrier-protein] synthase-3